MNNAGWLALFIWLGAQRGQCNSMKSKLFLASLILAGICLLAPAALIEWRVNFSFITMSQLAYSSNENVTVTPEISNAIQTVCVRRSLDCGRIAASNKIGEKIKFVDLVNPVLFAREKSPLYFLNGPLALAPRDFYVEGNGLFSVKDDALTMFGTNYIEFRLYVPYTSASQKVDLAITALNSTPPPVQFNILIQDTVVDKISFDRGDGLKATKNVELTLEPGFNFVKVLYANDLFDKAKGIDRNAYILELTLAPDPARS